MAISSQRGARLSADLSFVLLAALLIILWLSGGASRESVTGQILSRGASWIAILVAALFARRPRIEEARGVLLILVAGIILCLAQLMPLPPGAWRLLPGRSAFADSLVSPPNSWRPLSLTPGATINTLLSLVIPLAVMILAANVREQQKRWIPFAVLAVISLALLLGLLQFTGAQIVNPLVNGTQGAVDGMIANRNHFALLLAIGLLLALVLGAEPGRAPRVRVLISLGLVLLLVLIILASGSRAGIGLGLTALVLGIVISKHGMKSALRRYPPWTLPAIVVGIVALIAIFVVASVAADRAVSVDRFIEIETDGDMRSRGLSTVLAIINTYFPLGTGLGTFDPIFRMHEPLALLKPTYFNHAHNDFLEIVLTAGLPGGLLIVAIGWWLWRSIEAWRRGAVLPKLGSATLLLILLASIVDYPARTPIIMAVATIAAVWLSEAPRAGLRARDQLYPD